MTSNTFLHGLALAGYRSFGPIIQRIGPFGAINLFAGPNNAGKSNILRFLHQHLYGFFGESQPVTGSITRIQGDIHEGMSSIKIGIAGRMDSLDLIENLHGTPELIGQLRKLLSADDFKHKDGLFWFDFAVSNSGTPAYSLGVDGSKLVPRDLTEQSIIGSLSFIFSAGRRSNTQVEMIHDILTKISPKRNPIPKVFIVPPFRSIDATVRGDQSTSIDGKGLVIELAKLKDFEPDQKQDGERFERIQRFVRSVIGNENAEIRIPFNRNTIAVKIGERDLTLEALGTGIHQTVLLAAMGTIVQDSIVCLEEPETNLHPVFQRKLLRYLATQTSNQYFIATHSAHLLDCGVSDLSAVAFRVQMENGCTIVDRVTTGTDRSNVCQELGYHASDIVQSNCVIWVEGPSDRIYLKHWIAAITPKLVEGIHFSIMFYGGSLLCYLTGVDEEGADEFTEFIALRRMNRHAIILIDSDKSSEGEEINEHKKRIETDFRDGGMVWITKGRMIENYLSDKARKAAFLDAHPRSQHHYGDGGDFGTVRRDGANFNKIKMARAAVKQDADLAVLDLKERIEEVVDFICKCNPV